MSCGCRRTPKKRFKWTDGTHVVYYDQELAAKAKIIRKGGSYTPVDN